MITMYFNRTDMAAIHDRCSPLTSNFCELPYDLNLSGQSHFHLQRAGFQVCKR